MRLRDLMPKGYKARNILILIVPMILFVIAMTLYFFSTHVQSVNRKLSRAVASEVQLVLKGIEADPSNWRAVAERTSAAGLMDLRFSPGAAVLTAPEGRACCPELRDELRNNIAAPFSFAIARDGFITLRVLGERGLVEAVFDRKRVLVVTAHIFIVWSVLFSLFLLATSYAFLRNQVRSILQLTRAADAFGRGEDAPWFTPSGAREVRQAARSIIRMRNRIRRFTDQRTAMLAGVSHDLRTPLARLKLELALLPGNADTASAKADIAEMERMLDGYLAFARGEESEQPEEVDLVALARDASSQVKNRLDLEFEAPEPVVMRLRPMALQRAVANLVNNAADHGKHVRITVGQDSASAYVAVEDNGPGIPAAQYEDAFRPFSRLDPARNQNVSGVGLGLTIARDAARAHGGDVTLGDSELGGLKATIRLPFNADRQDASRQKSQP